MENQYNQAQNQQFNNTAGANPNLPPNQPSAYPVDPLMSRKLNQIYLTNSGGANDPGHKTSNHKKGARIVPFLILIIVMLLTGYVFLVKKGLIDQQKFGQTNNPAVDNSNEAKDSDGQIIESKNPDEKPSADFTKAINSKEYSNCREVRKILETNNKIYIACEGGVLVLSADGSKIEEEISEFSGLTNPTSTDLLVSGNNIFIGTQKGVAIYDITTKSIKLLTSQNGLVDDRNITLAQDENSVWVGTFMGISKIDKKTLSIESFATIKNDPKLKPIELKNPNINRIIYAGKYILAIYNSDNDHSGGLLSYDQELKIWKVYEPASFTKSTNRIDFADIIALPDNSKIYLSSIDGNTYESKIQDNLVFTVNKNLNIVDPAAKRALSLRFISIIGNKMLFKTYNEFYLFDIISNTIITDAKLTVEDKAVMAKYNDWYKPKLSRAAAFGNIIFGYNENLLIRGDAALYKYNLLKDEFIKLTDLAGAIDEFHVKKVKDKPEILIAVQECMGECAVLKVLKYNLETEKIENIQLAKSQELSVYVSVNDPDKMILHTLEPVTKQTYTFINLETLAVTSEPYDGTKFKEDIDSNGCKIDTNQKFNVKLVPKLVDGGINLCEKTIFDKIKYFDIDRSNELYDSVYYSDTQSQKIALTNGYGLKIFKLE